MRLGRILLVASALAVLLAVPGAGAQGEPLLRLLGYGPAVISPNGNGIHDVLHVRVKAPAGSVLGLRAYWWGGRLHGWHRIRTGVTATAGSGPTELSWDGTNLLAGRPVGDGSYLVTVCYKDAGHALPPVIPPGQQRPGAAEATVSRPPWHLSGCLRRPRAIRVERLAAYVDSTSSFSPGQRPPLVVSADSGKATVRLEQDCSGRTFPSGTIPRGVSSGLYHYVVTDRSGDEFEAPLVVRNGRFPLEHPPPHTALIVWPYLTWRAYSAYDADLNGIPDTWYQWWRQRRVSLVGPLLQGGEEDDHKAAAPFQRWVCARTDLRYQSVTDVELRHMPLSTLKRYATVVFPGHSEYYQPGTYYLLRRYRNQGGHLLILQANPFYRSVRIDPKHNAEILLDVDARSANRSDFALAGVGYDGCCFPRSRATPYVAATGRDYQRVRWLFRGTGIGPGDSFGYAGSESDRIDPAFTPRDHVVAARAIMLGKFGVINAALVWSRAGRGEVLATGNYDFLRIGRGITWKLLDNVWRRFVD
jgi:hypothetical protein